ncbi:MAG TPA: metal-dependent transcriptional regulator [Chitinophagales bacterium]|nr:metal-dependent transcriptional regulator [Chitinophagales bacterium]
MNSLTEENYLKALLNLSSEKGEVSVSELSDHLEIKKPTVTSMMKKLDSKGLIEYESYKPIKLSEIGKKEAALIIRKHRLTEMFLVEKMHFGWEEVHQIAEQIEHLKSHVFFERMDEILGYPKFDPHGSPIPDADGNMTWKSYKKLTDCKVGDRVKIEAVTNSSSEFLKFLNTREISLGLEVKVISMESFDQSMVISYQNHPHENLSNIVTEKLLVEKI